MSETGLRGLLRKPAFLRYITGEAISMTGTWMQVMAQGWVMTSLTDKAKMLGMVNLVAGIPMFALTMVGGKFADQYNKRNILLVTQVVQILAALALGRLVATGQIQIWHILVAAFFLGISAAFEMPAASALVPELVGQELIAPATGVDRAVFHGTRLIGPAVAGWLIGRLGTEAAFYANALSFVALIAALLTLPARPPGTAAEEEQRRGSIRDGFRHVRGDATTVAMLGLMMVTVVFVFPVFTVMMPLYSRTILGLPPEKMGVLMGMGALGALTGSLTLLGISPRVRRPVLFGGATLAALALLGAARAERFGVAAGLLVCMSIGTAVVAALANTIMQERAPEAMRGRVAAIAGMCFFGLMPLAGIGLPSLADHIGMRPAMVVSAIAYFVGAMWVLVRLGRRQI